MKAQKALQARSLQARWLQLRERFDALSLRERVLTVTAVFAVVWLLWSWTADRWLALEIDRQGAEVDSLRQQLVAEAAVQERLRNQAAADPRATLERERDALEQRLSTLDSRLQDVVGRFVDPQHMPVVLEDLLRRHDGVELVAVRSLPVRPVTAGADDETVDGLYRHAVQVQLSGRYLDLMAYLRAVEDTPWQFLWRSLDYRVQEYPMADMQVVLETLSREKSWLGV